MDTKAYERAKASKQKGVVVHVVSIIIMENIASLTIITFSLDS